ncbi:hypothetical protein JD81_02955 [Micromonospora sagamiensis]|uniref:Uncharacterized protein n=1 Tax=Micromonospora sagamiensis TaxID=47875 RepID=A0A562WGY6_9ACTN|nr:hypothetical protein JD81_02955 [Micromonospora sagamiensis]
MRSILSVSGANRFVYVAVVGSGVLIASFPSSSNGYSKIGSASFVR